MILGPTRVIGDVYLADGKNIFTSGRVTTSPFAIFESATVETDKSVLLSTQDTVPGTIKTTDTTVTATEITVPHNANISANTHLSITADELNFGNVVVNTELSTKLPTTVAAKLPSVAVEWEDSDRVLIDGAVCYIHSTNRFKESFGSEDTLALIPPGDFVAPSSSLLKDVTTYYLITDRLFEI